MINPTSPNVEEVTRSGQTSSLLGGEGVCENANRIFDRNENPNFGSEHKVDAKMVVDIYGPIPNQYPHCGPYSKVDILYNIFLNNCLSNELLEQCI